MINVFRRETGCHFVSKKNPAAVGFFRKFFCRNFSVEIFFGNCEKIDYMAWSGKSPTPPWRFPCGDRLRVLYCFRLLKKNNAAKLASHGEEKATGRKCEANCRTLCEEFLKTGKSEQRHFQQRYRDEFKLKIFLLFGTMRLIEMHTHRRTKTHLFL